MSAPDPTKWAVKVFKQHTPAGLFYRVGVAGHLCSPVWPDRGPALAYAQAIASGERKAEFESSASNRPESAQMTVSSAVGSNATDPSPAPWIVDGDTIREACTDKATGRRFAVARVSNAGRSPERAAANAQLLASAPELKAALRQMVNMALRNNLSEDEQIARTERAVALLERLGEQRNAIFSMRASA